MTMDISVVVPAFNEEKYIERTLRSIKKQNTDLKYEIIVSDSGSTDGTLRVARKYADKIITTKRRGVAIARNNGALAAEGDILIFVDADTEIAPDYLAAAYREFEKHPSLAALSFAFKFSKRTPSLLFAEEAVNNYLLMRSRLESATLPGGNTAILREKFMKIGGYKNVLLEDVRLSRDLDGIGHTEYIGDKKVITSSRKLEQLGLLGTLRYYLELDLRENANGYLAKNIAARFKILNRFKTLNEIKKRIKKKVIKRRRNKNIR